MRSKLHYTASGIITPVGGRPVHENLRAGANGDKFSEFLNLEFCYINLIFQIKL